MKHSLLGFVLPGLIATLLVACGSSDDSQESGVLCHSHETFEVDVATSYFEGASNNSKVTPDFRQTAHCGATVSYRIDTENGDAFLAQGCGGTVTGDNYTTGLIVANCQVRISFLPTLEVTTNAGLHGSISPASALVPYGQTREFEVSADDGYVVETVSGCDGHLNGNIYTTGPVRADCQLSVEYLEIPDIAGIWAGTWEGVDSSFGPVSGTWITKMSQNNTELHGPIVFGGDLDCAEGNMTGVADPRNSRISGDITRDPCPSNSWLFSAFNEVEIQASGSWRKAGLSNGAFEGQRISTFTGPYIEYVYPPGASSGAYVTIVGERLSMDLVNHSLTLGPAGTVLVPETATDSSIRVKLPGVSGVNDRLVLTTADGQALSPRPFNTDMTSPVTGYRQDISLNSLNSMPVDVIFSVNNRRAFIANRGNGSVSMINTDMGRDWISTAITPDRPIPAPVYSVAVDPAGRKLYAAGANLVAVLHAHTMELLQTVDLTPTSLFAPGSMVVAVSPDGRWLVIGETADGGSVSLLDVSNNYAVTDTLVIPAGSTPRGIAISPNNTRFYVAVSGSTNEVRVYNLEDGVEETAIAVGAGPAEIAITPDARRIYVTNLTGGLINYHDLDGAAGGAIDLGNNFVAGKITITPDGAHLYASGNSSSIQVIDVGTHQAISVYVGAPSSAVAISRDGKRAYVTLEHANKVVEIGNQRTLRISKQGGAIGTVETSPVGINCGTSCIASFSAGSAVKLIATPINASYEFIGWGGDGDCLDGFVSMGSNLYCVARFQKVYVPPPSGGGPSGGSSGGSSSCFIATAAYGSWLDPHVMTLRIFRDEHLLTTAAGTLLVEFYYRHSPPIADYIRERETLRTLVRAVLGVVVYSIEYPAAALLLFIMPWLLLAGMRRRNKDAAGCRAMTGK